MAEWLAPTIAVIVAAFLGGIGWLIKLSVDSFRETSHVNAIAVADLYAKYNTLADGFHELKGEHKARTCKGS